MASNGPSVMINIGGKVAASLGAAVNAVKSQVEGLNRSIRVQQRMNEQTRAAYRGQIVDAVALGMSLRAVVAPAIEFESAMADVRKVVDFADPVVGLNNMSDAIKDMARTIPISQAGLAAIVAAGGRMGIAEGDLRGYAETVAKMSTAWEMAPDAAGEAMAKISNIMGLSIAEIGKIGDAINTLDDSSAAKASEIVDVLKRTGGLGKQFGLTTQQLAALSTTMLDLGSSPEVAGTGINALLGKLQAAPAQSKKFQAALKQMGWSAKGMQKAIQKDAQGTLTTFLNKLQGMDKLKQANLLAELFGAEYSDDIAKLVGGLDKYKKHLATVSNEANYAGSMQREFEIRTQTAANQLEIASNLTREAAINIGSALLPSLVSVLKIMGALTSGVADFAQAHPFVIKATVGVAAALIGVKIAAIGTGYAWTFVKGAALTGASAAVKAAGMLVATARTMTSASAMIALAGRVIRGALVSTGIGAVMVAAGMAIAWVANNTENLGIAWEAFKGAFDRAIAPIKPAIDAVAGPVTSMVGWFTDLIGPVEGAEGAFARFGINAGKAVGGVVVGIVDIAKAIGTFFGQAVDGAVARFSAIRDAFDQGVIQGIRAVIVNFNPLAPFQTAIAALTNYLSTIDLSASGMALIDTIANGVRARASALVDSVKGVLNWVGDMLPHSDAKVGPLSTLTSSGMALVSTIGEGVNKAGAVAIARPLTAAFAGAVATLPAVGAEASTGLPAAVQPATEAMASAASGGAAAIAGGRSGAGAVTMTNNITVTVPPGADARSIEALFRDMFDRLMSDAEAARRSALHD